MEIQGVNHKEQTFGQKAVGLDFNPSGNPDIIKAKQLIAEAIDLLERIHKEETTDSMKSASWIRNVFRTQTFNLLVSAQMALVKYITWRD